MDDAFDPYHKWLGIPPAEQPPDHYRLLGLSTFEDDPTVIESSADRQMTHVRTFQTGPHAGCSQRLLNEIAAARLCLLKPRRKAEYDQALRDRLVGPAVEAAPTAGVFAPAVPPAAAPIVAAQAPPPLAVHPALAIAPPIVAPPVAVAGRNDAQAASLRASRRRRGIPVAPVAASVAVLAVVAGLLIAAGLREPAAQQAAIDSQPAGSVEANDGQAPAPRMVVRINPVDESTPAGRPDAPNITTSSRTVDNTNRNDGDRVAISTTARPSASAPRPTTPAPRPATTRTTPPPSSPQSATTKPASTTPPPAPDLSLPKAKPSAPRLPGNVHKDAIHFDGNWYLFSEEKSGFVRAFATAKRFRGRMVVVSSPEENAFVASQVKGPTWLGMERQGTAWMNAVQKPQTWFNWDRGQPQSGPREVFAAIHANGRWHDYQPDKLYLCIEWGDE